VVAAGISFLDFLSPKMLLLAIWDYCCYPLLGLGLQNLSFSASLSTAFVEVDSKGKRMQEMVESNWTRARECSCTKKKRKRLTTLLG